MEDITIMDKIEAEHPFPLARELFALPESMCRADPGQPDLFGNPPPKPRGAASMGTPSGKGRPMEEELLGLSVYAYDSLLHAWMSELPIQGELLRFAQKVIAAGRKKGRNGAEQAASDRGDPAVSAVLEAADKTRHEIDRLRGLLRFSPNSRGIYVARCSPDHCILPALGDHFFRRFGETPWAIIDEKRGLGLLRLPNQAPRFVSPDHPVFNTPNPGNPDEPAPPDHHPDPWEDLWRNYHRSINNEGRENPKLQRQFMPRRYWKYLPELKH